MVSRLKWHRKSAKERLRLDGIHPVPRIVPFQSYTLYILLHTLQSMQSRHLLWQTCHPVFINSIHQQVMSAPGKAR